jgi:hypothetical protein
MKTRNLLTAAAVLAAVLAFGGEALARGGNGGNGGGGGGKGMQVRTHTQSRAQTMTNAQTNQVRPEGSQRRDGTFLQTGTTANGSTTRPSRGQGVMDGSGLNAPITTPVPAE